MRKESNEMMYAVTANRVLLGLLMLVAGSLKLFMFKPSGVSGMLAGMGFPIPMLFAWILILSEIVFGIAVLANYKLEWTTIPLIVIMLVAALLTSKISTDLAAIEWSKLLQHLAIAANFWVFRAHALHSMKD